MVNTIYLLSFVETPRKFIIAELSIRKLGSSSVISIISTDEDPSLRIESSAIINLRGVSTKLNKYISFLSKVLKLNLIYGLTFGDSKKTNFPVNDTVAFSQAFQFIVLKISFPTYPPTQLNLVQSKAF